jgi:hypothetical protein
LKEQDLKDLGFKKVKISAKESGGDPYHYYTFDFFKKDSAISLISTASDESKDGWSIYFMYESRPVFSSKKDLKKFIEIIKNNDTRNKRKKTKA